MRRFSRMPGHLSHRPAEQSRQLPCQTPHPSRAMRCISFICRHLLEYRHETRLRLVLFLLRRAGSNRSSRSRQTVIVAGQTGRISPRFLRLRDGHRKEARPGNAPALWLAKRRIPLICCRSDGAEARFCRFFASSDKSFYPHFAPAPTGNLTPSKTPANAFQTEFPFCRGVARSFKIASAFCFLGFATCNFCEKRNGTTETERLRFAFLPAPESGL